MMRITVKIEKIVWHWYKKYYDWSGELSDLLWLGYKIESMDMTEEQQWWRVVHIIKLVLIKD